MLNKHALGVAFGAVTAVWMLLVIMVVNVYGVGDGLLDVYEGFVPGFSRAGLGTVLGLVGGFVEGYIIGWLLAWVYNRVAGK